MLRHPLFFEKMPPFFIPLLPPLSAFSQSGRQSSRLDFLYQDKKLRKKKNL